MITYKIPDLISRLKAANKLEIKNLYIEYSSSEECCPCSIEICDILNVLNEECPNLLTFRLFYPNSLEITLLNPFTSLELISKPSKRRYIKAKNIRTLNRGMGFYILRTSQGIMSSNTASTLNLGGEILLKIA